MTARNQMEVLAKLVAQISAVKPGDPLTPEEWAYYEEQAASDRYYDAEVVHIADWCDAVDQRRKEAREWRLCEHGQHAEHCPREHA